MAEVNEEFLKKNIASKKLLPVYLLFGDDAYLKLFYTNKISRMAAEPDDVFNYCKFTDKCDLQAVYDAVMQFPFMNDKKAVILSDYDFGHCSKTDFDRLNELIGEVPDTAVLILNFDSVETDHKKDAKFKKIITAVEKCGGLAVLLNHRSRAELIKMLSDGAAKRGCTLDRNVAAYLVETAGEDINLLKNELDKLCTFKGTGTVQCSDVDEVCTKTVEANVYRLSDYILDCDATKALKTLDELFFMRLEPMIIFSTVSGVYVDMYRMYAAHNKGLKTLDVSKTFGYKGKEFLLEKAAKNLRKFDFNKLSLSLEALMKADNDLKSFGLDSRAVLEQLTVKLIYIIAKGEPLDKT